MAYTDIDDPSAYFQNLLWTGNNTDGTALTFDGNSDMQPDFVWVKHRNGTGYHGLFDSVRGVTKRLHTNTTSAEGTVAESLQSFNSNGFTVGNNSEINGSSKNYVSWNWKTGTAFSNDASGTGIGSIDSAGSVNQDAGFSIVSYTGTGSNGTIKHGLNSAPSTIIHKRLNSTSGWVVWHKSIGTNILELDGTGAAQGGSSYINGTVPTSSVFSVGTSGDINASGGTYIAYCFAEKKGYLKTGKWIGNGNNNGPFSFCGFKPAFILIKRTDVAKNWYINDNLRLGYNPSNPYLSPNLTATETGGTEINML